MATTHYTHMGSSKAHDFYTHVNQMLGSKILTEGQDQYGGYTFINENTIVARSTISALQPVIEQAIKQIVGTRTLEQAAKAYGSYEKLEARIARQLTNLNDWAQLSVETQNEIMILTGINFDGMSRQEQEETINHLLHSPLPFGDIKEVLSPSTKIDMGYTHTLDKSRTMVEDLGDGHWKIYMISNNNNGSHTGHTLGSFVVDLGKNATAEIAKSVGNSMVINTNDNTKLYLDQAARDVLYGKVEKNDFSEMETAGHDQPAQGHDFVSHVEHLMPGTLAEGQDKYGGYNYITDEYIIARSPITGLQPVIEQAIRQVLGTRTLEQAAKAFGGYDKLEARIALQLTNLNDWQNLQEKTQADLMIMTGVNIDAMSPQDREKYVNHLLHSPLPFGDIEKVLETNVKIDMGYTHTLDKTKTTAEHLGDGIYKVTMISNNNNGSHTGHSLGSFKIDLSKYPGAADGSGREDLAIELGNRMVVNTNNNNKLYLDQAARDLLYGVTDKLDHSVDNPYKGGGHNHGDDEDATLHHDTSETQYVIGGDGKDVFVIDGNSSDYGWEKTDDGGYVVWSNKGHDILYNVEQIRFKDTTIDLTDTSTGETGDKVNEIADKMHETQYVFGTDGKDVFVINGKSSDYGWSKTDDGGYVVWSSHGHDLLYNVESIRFSDKTVDLSGTDGGNTSTGENKIKDKADETQYVTGTDAKDIFVIDGKASDYGWGKTEDGGVVVWSGDQHDVLYDVEELQFNDQKVDLSEYYA